MAGGPVSGASWLPNSDSTDVIIPTTLQIAKDVLDYWTSMTCLYDRYWVAEQEKITLPICMFHVKKIVPTYTVETSKKRVILYEPQQDSRFMSAEASDQMRRGIMQTIVDNAVKQPVTYNMEIIVPFQPVGRYVSEGTKLLSDVLAAFGDLTANSTMTSFFEDSISSVSSYIKTAMQAMQLAMKLPNMDGVSYLNMNSLEAMANSCRTLCMKMWTGYEYKFVIITGMTYEKQPLEDDVFRASLNLQEIPVLSVTRPAPSRPHVIDRNWASMTVSSVQQALITPITGLMGVHGENAANDRLVPEAPEIPEHVVNMRRGREPE